ncbi:MAG: MBL fold metallo-hydrolase [Clostridia bacterium]|nr:MBL fold metallo-hydrolase [Clostridia bacterium]
MKLEWIGHACFKMTAQDGTVVITDPYDESVGIGMIPLEADMITMSHGHHDHCEQAMIVGDPVIVRGQETVSLGSVTAHAARSYHDDAQGTLRGENVIRIFEIDGLRIVHMGDQGCMPDGDVLAAIADADVMLIPVGGTYTVDAVGAKAVIGAARPVCVVPMHVKTKRCPYPIAPVTAFLEVMGAQDVQPCCELELTKGHLPQGVVLMQPQADTL